ncbi:MAG: flavodoxin family protein [Elusimicrobia bacterium]|nr:flavodoxin family protein [Elusimicrobiota bacterium]
MAEFVAKGVKEENCEVTVKTVENVLPDELVQYDGLIFGSPTYYGQMAAPVKKLLDDSVILHGKLEGKVSGAFTSSANIGGGNRVSCAFVFYFEVFQIVFFENFSRRQNRFSGFIEIF